MGQELWTAVSDYLDQLFVPHAAMVELRQGVAGESLAEFIQEGAGPFERIFIDADKEGYSEYLGWVLNLSVRGTLIVADNVVRDRAVDPSSTDSRVHGTRRINELLATEPRVQATLIQTVGKKGYDGVALAVVIDDP